MAVSRSEVRREVLLLRSGDARPCARSACQLLRPRQSTDLARRGGRARRENEPLGTGCRTIWQPFTTSCHSRVTDSAGVGGHCRRPRQPPGQPHERLPDVWTQPLDGDPGTLDEASARAAHCSHKDHVSASPAVRRHRPALSTRRPVPCDTERAVSRTLCKISAQNLCADSAVGRRCVPRVIGRESGGAGERIPVDAGRRRRRAGLRVDQGRSVDAAHPAAVPQGSNTRDDVRSRLTGAFHARTIPFEVSARNLHEATRAIQLRRSRQRHSTVIATRSPSPATILPST